MAWYATACEHGKEFEQMLKINPAWHRRVLLVGCVAVLRLYEGQTLADADTGWKSAQTTYESMVWCKDLTMTNIVIQPSEDLGDWGVTCAWSSWGDPAREDDAVQKACALAQIFVGRDVSLAVRSVKLESKLTDSYATGTQTTKIVSLKRAAKVCLESLDKERPWSFCVEYDPLTIECTPPPPMSAFSRKGFTPSQFYLAWTQNPLDAHKAVVQGVQVHHIIGGVLPGETVRAWQDSDTLNWIVEVVCHAWFGCSRTIIFSPRGELLSVKTGVTY